MLGIRTWPLPAVAAYPRLTLNSCRRWWTVWCGLACIPAIMARLTNRWQTLPLRRITKLSMSIRSLQNGGTLLLRVRTTSRSRRMLARPSILRQCVATTSTTLPQRSLHRRKTRSSIMPSIAESFCRPFACGTTSTANQIPTMWATRSTPSHLLEESRMRHMQLEPEP